ncbi:MAG: hypothetical protein RL693_1230 [Verrucomicrobiota bacterium]|jgi:outer membrane protein TolC
MTFSMRCLVFFLLCTTALSAAEPRVVTLEQAYDMVLETDQSVKIAWYAAKKANLEPQFALTRMRPTLSAGASGERQNRSGSNPLVRSSSGQADITLEQPIFDLTVFPAFRRGKLVSKSAELQYRALLREVLLSVTTAYYEVLQQEQIISVNTQGVQLAQENVDVAEKRSRAGEVTRTDVLRATASFQENKRALIESTSILDVRRNVLANLLNIDPAVQTVMVKEPGEQITNPAKFDVLLERAYAHREDLQAQALVIQQDVESRKEIRAGYAPKVSAQLGAQTSGSNSSTTNGTDNHSWQAVINVNIPFLTGGQRELDIKVAGYQIEQSKLDYENLRKSIQEEVKNAWVTVRTLTETIIALKAQVEAAQQGYQDILSQYKAGTTKSIDVLDALQSLNDARKDLAVQSYGYQVALRKVEQVSGVFQEPRVSQAIKP